MILLEPIKTIKYFYAFVKEYHTGLIRGALTFLDNSLVYLYDKKPSRGPTFVGWNVLFNCNAVCSFCDTHELHKQLDREMTNEEAMSIVKQLGEAGTWHLSLTGGETLLRKIYQKSSRKPKNMACLLTSTLTARYWQKKPSAW